MWKVRDPTWPHVTASFICVLSPPSRLHDGYIVLHLAGIASGHREGCPTATVHTTTLHPTRLFAELHRRWAVNSCIVNNCHQVQVNCEQLHSDYCHQVQVNCEQLHSDYCRYRWTVNSCIVIIVIRYRWAVNSFMIWSRWRIQDLIRGLCHIWPPMLSQRGGQTMFSFFPFGHGCIFSIQRRGHGRIPHHVYATVWFFPRSHTNHAPCRLLYVQGRFPAWKSASSFDGTSGTSSSKSTCQACWSWSSRGSPSGSTSKRHQLESQSASSPSSRPPPRAPRPRPPCPGCHTSRPSTFGCPSASFSSSPPCSSTPLSTSSRGRRIVRRTINNASTNAASANAAAAAAAAAATSGCSAKRPHLLPVRKLDLRAQLDQVC